MFITRSASLLAWACAVSLSRGQWVYLGRSNMPVLCDSGLCTAGRRHGLLSGFFIAVSTQPMQKPQLSSDTRGNGCDGALFHCSYPFLFKKDVLCSSEHHGKLCFSIQPTVLQGLRGSVAFLDAEVQT